MDVTEELKALQQQSAEIKQQGILKRATRWRYNHRSRLDRWAAELISLHQGGATVAELQRWLRQNHRIKVYHSTVKRWIEKHGQIRES